MKQIFFTTAIIIILLGNLYAQVNLDSGLVAYYPFNGNANDESGNGNDGTVLGATLTPDRFGNVNSAYSFDGVDDYIEIPSSLTFSEITFSAWINAAIAYINNRGIFTIDDTGGQFFIIRGNSVDALSVIVNGVEVNEYEWSFEIDVWTHIAVTYDGYSIIIYKNGVSTETGGINGLPITGIIYIGGVGRPVFATEFWDGDIDDVWIYNRALSEDEIDSLFSIITDINKSEDNLPINFALHLNYPNPFNPITTINYQIPELSFVTLKIYDVLGSEVTTLLNEEKEVGGYEVEFDGRGLPSGIYFYRLQAGSFIETKKMLLLK